MSGSQQKLKDISEREDEYDESVNMALDNKNNIIQIKDNLANQIISDTETQDLNSSKISNQDLPNKKNKKENQAVENQN